MANGARLATADGSGSFVVNYGPASAFDPKNVVLSNFAVAGDFDHDGDVDGRDFLVWQRGGSPSPLSPGDLLVWQTRFGTGAAVAAMGAVPEPGVGTLSLAALAAAASRRRRV